MAILMGHQQRRLLMRKLERAALPLIVMGWVLFFTVLANAQTQCLVPAAVPATPVVSGSLESGHVLKASPGCLLSGYATVDATTTGYLMVFNSITVPSDGAVTPIECVYTNLNPGSVGVNFAPLPPEFFSVGISIAFSSTGCFTKTASPHAFFHAIVQ